MHYNTVYSFTIVHIIILMQSAAESLPNHATNNTTIQQYPKPPTISRHFPYNLHFAMAITPLTVELKKLSDYIQRVNEHLSMMNVSMATGNYSRIKRRVGNKKITNTINKISVANREIPIHIQQPISNHKNVKHSIISFLRDTFSGQKKDKSEILPITETTTDNYSTTECYYDDTTLDKIASSSETSISSFEPSTSMSSSSPVETSPSAITDETICDDIVTDEVATTVSSSIDTVPESVSPTFDQTIDMTPSTTVNYPLKPIIIIGKIGKTTTVSTSTSSFSSTTTATPTTCYYDTDIETTPMSINEIEPVQKHIHDDDENSNCEMYSAAPLHWRKKKKILSRVKLMKGLKNPRPKTVSLSNMNKQKGEKFWRERRRRKLKRHMKNHLHVGRTLKSYGFHDDQLLLPANNNDSNGLHVEEIMVDEPDDVTEMIEDTVTNENYDLLITNDNNDNIIKTIDSDQVSTTNTASSTVTYHGPETSILIEIGIECENGKTEVNNSTVFTSTIHYGSETIPAVENNETTTVSATDNSSIATIETTPNIIQNMTTEQTTISNTSMTDVTTPLVTLSCPEACEQLIIQGEENLKEREKELDERQNQLNTKSLDHYHDKVLNYLNHKQRQLWIKNIKHQDIGIKLKNKLLQELARHKNKRGEAHYRFSKIKKKSSIDDIDEDQLLHNYFDIFDKRFRILYRIVKKNATNYGHKAREKRENDAMTASSSNNSNTDVTLSIHGKLVQDLADEIEHIEQGIDNTLKIVQKKLDESTSNARERRQVINNDPSKQYRFNSRKILSFGQLNNEHFQNNKKIKSKRSIKTLKNNSKYNFNFKRMNHDCADCICDIENAITSLKQLLTIHTDTLDRISRYSCDKFVNVGKYLELTASLSQPRALDHILPLDSHQSLVEIDNKGLKYIKFNDVEDILHSRQINSHEYEVLYIPGSSHLLNIPCRSNRSDDVINWLMSFSRPNYTWTRHDGIPISGIIKTNGDLELYQIDAVDAGNYSCIVTYIDSNDEKLVQNIYEHTIKLVTLPHYTIRADNRYKLHICDEDKLDILTTCLPNKLNEIVCKHKLCEAFIFVPRCHNDDVSIRTLIIPSNILKIIPPIITSQCGLKCHKAIQDKIVLLLMRNLRAVLQKPIIFRLSNHRHERLVPVEGREEVKQKQRRNIHDDDTDDDIGLLVGCPAGYHLEYNYCEPCPSGFHSQDLSWRCQQCPLGTYQPNMGAKTCQTCTNPFVNDCLIMLWSSLPIVLVVFVTLLVMLVIAITFLVSMCYRKPRNNCKTYEKSTNVHDQLARVPLITSNENSDNYHNDCQDSHNLQMDKNLETEDLLTSRDDTTQLLVYGVNLLPIHRGNERRCENICCHCRRFYCQNSCERIFHDRHCSPIPHHCDFEE